MAAIAGVWNTGRHREHAAERVTADVDGGNRLLNLRHVARRALVSDAAGFVAGVLLNGRSAGTVCERGPDIAGEAHLRVL